MIRLWCFGIRLARHAALASAFILLAFPQSTSAGDRITGRDFATRSEVIAKHGMAATSQPLATQAALDILKQGGNAIDAAIAANAMLGLVEPTGNGIGGDLFAIVWIAETSELHGLNASGRSPQSLDLETLRGELDALERDSIPPRGPLPVTVPGTIDGWFELHDRFGKLPMKDVLAPAIRYAREGFPVTELIAYYWQRHVPLLGEFPGFRETFMPGGEAPKKGEMFANPDLANTLERIANEGRDVFYKGEMAEIIGRTVQAQGGYLSAADMAAHTSEWVTPKSTNYRGYDVWQLPPNTQGIAVLQILNLLEAYDLASMDIFDPHYVHLFLEAKKLTFEDRARWYADPDFAELPIDGLISKAYADERRALIDPERAARRVEAGHPGLEEGDTVYLTTADKDRNMVSLIQSNYRGMGSGVIPEGLGFILQDRGELFSLEPGHPNVYEPAKRPFHTIIPGFVTKDGKPWLAFGVMGGATQPQAQAKVLINLIDFGMNLQEAGDAPRILHSGSSEPTGDTLTPRGGHVALETGFPYETVRELAQRGHDMRWAVGPFGGYQAILYDAENDVLIGASESRKDGQAAGY
ncbi:MAG: gamma-glutamyltransferase [Acidobacteriota bacterium]